MSRLKLSRRAEAVAVPRSLLRRHGWTRLVADAPEEESFRGLLAELRRERAVHSWRWLAPRGGLKELLAAEARLRPGVVYAYYAERRDGARELVASAAAAERVSAAFPHDGFPVIARGFVRRRYRGDGLYAALLAHRVRACRRAWGARLEAIHLGSANPRVWRAISGGGGRAKFVPIGVETLGAGGCRVRDFASFTPAFARRLRSESAGRRELRVLLARLLLRGFTAADYGRLSDAWEAAGRPSRALGRLMTLFAAIPLERRRPPGRASS